MASRHERTDGLEVALRSQLWRQRDWAEPIACRAAELMQGNGAGLAEGLALARLAESVLPDRRVAISLYRWAYGHESNAAWIQRARRLAQELGDFHLVAELAELEYHEQRDAGLLVVQALALLDAGESQLAIAPLAWCLARFPNDSSLALLHRGARGELANIQDSIGSLEREAEASVKFVRAGLLLQAARLSRLMPSSEDTLHLLMRAFDAYPGDESVFALLENRWIADGDWRRLSNLYRIRAEAPSAKERGVEILRRAGLRLVGIGASKGLGVRLLQEGVQAIYQRNLEEDSSLIAMLSLIVAELSASGATPSAVRLLAKALAHPRSDDEVMWIVNNGIALSEGVAALERTTATFKALRERVLARNPEYDAGHGDALEIEARHAIDDELQELTRPRGLATSVAERVDIAVDVRIAVRAEIRIGTASVEAMTRDLSRTGVFLACKVFLLLGDELSFTMLLPGQDDWSLLEHELRGVVARVEVGVGYGIRFTEVPQAYLDNLNDLHASLQLESS